MPRAQPTTVVFDHPFLAPAPPRNPPGLGRANLLVGLSPGTLATPLNPLVLLLSKDKREPICSSLRRVPFPRHSASWRERIRHCGSGISP